MVGRDPPLNVNVNVSTLIIPLLPEFMSQLIGHMEHTAQRRKKKTNTTNPAGPGSAHGSSMGREDEAEDPYTKLARKVRIVKDRLFVSTPSPPLPQPHHPPPTHQLTSPSPHRLTPSTAPTRPTRSRGCATRRP